MNDYEKGRDSGLYYFFGFLNSALSFSNFFGFLRSASSMYSSKNPQSVHKYTSINSDVKELTAMEDRSPRLLTPLLVKIF